MPCPHEQDSSRAKLIVSRKVSEEDWNLDLLMNAMEEEITARERVGAGQSRPPTRRNEQKTPPTATALVLGDTSNVQLQCTYCNRLHSPHDCDTVTQVEARKQSLRRNARCFSCLRRGHLSREGYSTWSVCLSVHPSVCLLVCYSKICMLFYDYSHTAGYEVAYQ